MTGEAVGSDDVGDPGRRDVVVDRLSEYAAVRRAADIDAQIYLFDDDAALIAFVQDQQYVGLTVRNRTLGRTLIHLFEALWEVSD